MLLTWDDISLFRLRHVGSRINAIANQAAVRIADNRHTTSIEDNLLDILEEYQVKPCDGVPLTEKELSRFAEVVQSEILKDKIYDSEESQAWRACSKIFYRLYGSHVTVVGLVPGEEIAGRQITGNVCSVCKEQPETGNWTITCLNGCMYPTL